MLKVVLLFLLGALAPIDVFGDVPPWTLDVARYVSAFLLIFLARGDWLAGSGAAKFATLLLASVSGIGLLRTVFHAPSGAEGIPVVGFVSVVLAYLVTRNSAANYFLIVGLLFGACLSAIDIVLQLAGLPFLGVPTAWGARFSGLSFTSTNTAPYLALGAVLVISRFLWRPIWCIYLLRLGLIALLVTGLLASGGRGGLAGLGLALLVWVGVRLRTHPLAGVLAGIVATCVVIVGWDRAWSFLNRSDSGAGLSSGRGALNEASWEAFMGGGIFGVDLGIRGQFRPHTPILTFSLDAGAVGFVAALVLVAMLAWRIVRPAAPGAAGELLSMMAAILLVTSLLEPTGFFVGLSKAIIFLVVVAGGGLSSPGTGSDAHFYSLRSP